jgi:hypothetical protein
MLFEAALRTKAGQETLQNQIELYRQQQTIGDTFDQSREARAFGYGQQAAEAQAKRGESAADAAARRSEEAAQAEQQRADERLGKVIPTPGVKGYQGAVVTSPKSAQLVPEPSAPAIPDVHESKEGLYFLHPDGTAEFIRDPDDKSKVLQGPVRADQGDPIKKQIAEQMAARRAAGQPGASPSPGPTPKGKPVLQKDIDLLKSNPTPQRRQQFDVIYGAGAAARILGGI